MSASDWFDGGGDMVTHWCAGMSDDKKHNNKPDMKVTHTDMTRWFNPVTLDKETGVLTCVACGESPKDGEAPTQLEIGE